MSKKVPVKTILLVVCVAAMFASCARLRPAPPLPVGTLEYKLEPGMRRNFAYVGSSTIQLSQRPDKTLASEPTYMSKEPLYGTIKLGASEPTSYVFAIDESKGTRSGLDTLCVDANNNGNLADDAKIAPKPIQGGGAAQFPPVELAVTSDGRPYPYHLEVHCCGSSRDHVHVYPGAYCEGEISFGDKTHKIALFDDNCNGTFNDPYAVPENYGRDGPVYARGDTLVIDLDGDGKLSKEYNDTAEMFHLGNYMSFGDRCYRVDIAPSGNSMIFQEADVPCGYIAVDAKRHSVELLGDDGALKLSGSDPREKAPAGEYRIAACSFEREDEQGALWRIVGRGDWSQRAIEVNADEKTALKVGPPLTAEVTVSKEGNSIALGLDVKGQSGETYSTRDFQKAGEGVPAPRFEVRTKKGETIARGQFEYG